MFIRGSGLAILSLAVFAGAPSAASAASFSAVNVFGDSLSDTGNLAETLVGANLANPPSFHDSFTNGPVAMELLAQHYGLRADPSLFATGFMDIHNLFGPGFVPGTNYAVGGATATDRGAAFFNLDLPEQVSAFVGRVGAGNAPASALYAVLIGGNDVRTAAHALDPSFVISGVSSELTQIQRLISNGAKTLLVSNVPDVGDIPEFTQESPPAEELAAQTYSVQYNTALAQGIAALETADPGVTFDYFDLFDYTHTLLAEAPALGFTNTTDPCYVTGFPPAPVIATAACGPADPVTGAAMNIDQFWYWDHIHPTARQQALWAEGFIAAVPEPSAFAILGIGLAGLALIRRKAA